MLLLIAVGNGVYKVIKSFKATDYEVKYYGDKYVYVGGQYQFQAGKTGHWNFMFADNNESYELKYLNEDGQYSNNYQLLNVGFSNFFN